jgi:peptide-methionine (S)-S-oxide reductase
MITNIKFGRISLFLFASILISVTNSCAGNKPAESKEVTEAYQKNGDDVAYFAAGCFWCVEAVFESVKGVNEAVSGYSGGNSKNPTYDKVSAGLTDHAEAVAVYYDPEVVDFATLVKVFFGSQDPTTPNQQGPDKGKQYRSIAFYQNETEQKIIEDYIRELEAQKVFSRKIVTEVKAFDKFYEAETYHQNYEKLNPNQPYVRAVSIPRLNQFKAKFPELLK